MRRCDGTIRLFVIPAKRGIEDERSSIHLTSRRAVRCRRDLRQPAEELRTALATGRSRGISDLARRSGVSRPGTYKALGEDGESRPEVNPSFETILGAMGLRLTVEPAEAA